ncbi:MAG: hypothetical protein H6Q25_141 [Bacteroidetes bacterium]|nr:hypothetical protein [Bacteroidota bacterium]
MKKIRVFTGKNYFFYLGIPAPPDPQIHARAVGLVPGCASLPCFTALRLKMYTLQRNIYRGARSSSHRLQRPPHP